MEIGRTNTNDARDKSTVGYCDTHPAFERIKKGISQLEIVDPGGPVARKSQI